MAVFFQWLATLIQPIIDILYALPTLLIHVAVTYLWDPACWLVASLLGTALAGVITMMDKLEDITFLFLDSATLGSTTAGIAILDQFLPVALLGYLTVSAGLIAGVYFVGRWLYRFIPVIGN